jgi:hypothetical protein
MPVAQSYDRVQINVIEIRIKDDETLEVRASGALADSTINQPVRNRKPFDGALVTLTGPQHTSIRNALGNAIIPKIREILQAPVETYDIDQQGNVFVEVLK